VAKAWCTTHFGQLPPKRAKGKPAAEKRLVTLPAGVEAQEEERHAARALALQRREAVRRLLEGNAEARRQRVHVVAQLTRGGEKGRVGHQERGGGVVEQADADERRGFCAGGLVVAHGGVHRLPRFQQEQLEGQAEAAPLARQRFRTARAGASPGRSGGRPAAWRSPARARRAGGAAARRWHGSSRRGRAHLGQHRFRGGFEFGEVVGALVKKSRASSVGRRRRRPEGSAMPLASSRATRQAR
jgi:hypothetical protein